MDELEATKSALRIRLEEAKLQQQAHSLTRDQIRSFLARYQDIKEMPPEEQKKAIQVFVERVIVYEDRIDMDILTIPENSPDKKKITASVPTGGYAKTQSNFANNLDLLVEAVGIEPTSESALTRASPSAVIVLVSRRKQRPMTGFAFGQSRLFLHQVETPLRQ